MGKRNYLSIPNKFRPLKGRINIIVTTTKSFTAPNCLIAHNLEYAIELAKQKNKNIFIIGGGMLYEYALMKNLVDIIYLTRIHAEISGDVFFPKLNMKNWIEKSHIFHPKDKKHKYDFTFLKFERS